MVNRVLIGLIQLYRWLLSPVLGSHCRFYPSCSAYGVEALRCHGSVQGLRLMMRRIGRCHPWSAGGPDPVPPAPDRER